jgi:hypothetical protein
MIARELATTPSTASHFDFNVRALGARVRTA